MKNIKILKNVKRAGTSLVSKTPVVPGTIIQTTFNLHSNVSRTAMKTPFHWCMSGWSEVVQSEIDSYYKKPKELPRNRYVQACRSYHKMNPFIEGQMKIIANNVKNAVPTGLHESESE